MNKKKRRNMITRTSYIVYNSSQGNDIITNTTDRCIGRKRGIEARKIQKRRKKRDEEIQ